MDSLLEVKNLKKYFKTPNGLLHAVDDISFIIKPGETLGVVGESGCGKSTLGRVIVNLLEATDGEVIFKSKRIDGLRGKKLRELRCNMQMIFQDPFSSLNPRMSVKQLIAEPFEVNRPDLHKTEKNERIKLLMSTVGISDRLLDSYPHELDGGRRQRIGIARALALEPQFIVCDEPVSALDVSIQAQILNLMQDLQNEKKLTYLFITHDLSVVRHMSDYILVMYMGKAMEMCHVQELFNNYMHPYTKALLAAIPIPSSKKPLKRMVLHGEVSHPINPKPGCRFAPRCPNTKDICKEQTPVFEEKKPGHFVACHFTT